MVIVFCITNHNSGGLSPQISLYNHLQVTTVQMYCMCAVAAKAEFVAWNISVANVTV
jgi:hypothetical protein